jgi:hypothetical protein
MELYPRQKLQHGTVYFAENISWNYILGRKYTTWNCILGRKYTTWNCILDAK